MNTIWTAVKTHKKTSALVVIILIFGGWYYYSKASSATVTTYIVRPATLGTVQTTVTGTGQVSSSQELTVNPQVSGTVTSIRVKDGDTVQAGQVLATLDSTDAEFSLQNAQIALAKLESSNPLTVTSNQNSVTSAQSSLAQSYTTAFNSLTSTYNDMGPIINDLNNLFYGTNVSPYFTEAALNSQGYGPTAEQYKQTAGVLLDKVKHDYSAFRDAYVTTNNQSTSTVTASLNQEDTVLQELLTTLKDTSVAVDYIISSTAKQNQTTAMTTDDSNLSSWLATINQDGTSIANAISSIQNNTNSYNQAVATLNEAQSGSNPLDLQSAQLALAQAQKTYDEYTIRAPISGVIGNVTLAVGDNATPSSVIGTVFTKSYISNIVLNEVDAAKVTIGQPVSVTFNALSGVTATGTVTDVDTIGTVSQGVVSYTDVISFNTNNPQIKLGMSINAVIVTSEDDNVVVVPNSALKTLGSRQYVLIPAAGQTGNTVTQVTQVTQKVVQTGLSDNINTEITSGLSVGDMVVTRTVVGTAATKTTQTNILSSLTGGRAGGTGGATRGAGGGFGGGTGGAARTTTTAPAAGN